MSEQINVDQAFNPELRQAQADFDAYLETRPYQGDDGKIYAPDGERIKKKAVDAYFDQARDSYYEESQGTSYEELTMSELADELAYAELTEDETKIGDLSDALLDKMEEFSSSQVTERNPDGMDGDAQMNLFDRVMRLKDQKKLRYLETNGHEISDRVRNEFLATMPTTTTTTVPETTTTTSTIPPKHDGYLPGEIPVNPVEASEKPSIEEMEAKFIDLLKQAGQADAEGREDAGKLLEEAQALGNQVYKAQIAELLAGATEAAKGGNFEEADKLEKNAHQILEQYLRLNGIDGDSDEAQAMRENLDNAIAGDDKDIFIATKSDDEADNDSIPAGSFDGNDAPPLVSASDRDSAPRPKTRWDRIKNVLGFGREDEERQGRGVSRMRRFMGGAALVGAGLVAGFLIGNSNNTTDAVPASSTTTTEAPAPTDTLPKSVQEELDQHKALEEAGVTDEATRVNIIHNPESFKRMVEDPESFASVVKWYENRVTELMQNDPSLSNDEARLIAEKQFNDYFEDLDDENAS